MAIEEAHLTEEELDAYHARADTWTRIRRLEVTIDELLSRLPAADQKAIKTAVKSTTGPLRVRGR